MLGIPHQLNLNQDGLYVIFLIIFLFLGYLQYETLKPYTFPPEAIVAIATGATFLILISVAVLLVYRRKSSQAEREYKRIQIQMDTLESNVRSECKQG
jgi:plexin A